MENRAKSWEFLKYWGQIPLKFPVPVWRYVHNNIHEYAEKKKKKKKP